MARRTRWLLTAPPGTALTVMVKRPSDRAGELVTEYERHSRTPSTSTPTRTYWPGSCGVQPRPGRSTTVTLSAVSGRTASTRARSTSALRSGAITSR